MSLIRLLVAYAVGLCLLSTHSLAEPVAAPLTAPPLNPDVRVLIDVSGSMKQNDPQNLRQPAVELLVKLLPQGSRGGIWSFGNDAESLVPQETVTDAWRLLAQDRAKRIDSRALFTNVGAALDAAARAGTPQEGYRTSLVLLTDGMVDISKDASVNTIERRRILQEVLPRLQDQGFVIHTIALSGNADKALLDQLAVGTGGLSTVAVNADELLTAFVKIIDAAAPAEQVTLEGNKFHIDPSIDEFTALIFHDADDGETRIQNPAGIALGSDAASENVSWYASDDYALATVRQPEPGAWQVLADAGPNSRVTVVSNLSLRVRELPVNVYRGQSVPVSFALQEDGRVITRAEFLSLMTFHAALLKDDGASLDLVWETELTGAEPPASGIFHLRLPKFAGQGDYRLQLRVDGKSFQREFTHNFTVRKPFYAELSGAQSASGQPRYNLTLHSNSPDINPNKTQVVATLVTPEDRRLIRPMNLVEQEHWNLRLQPAFTGRYRVNITVNGEDEKGTEFNYLLDELTFYYSPERGVIREEPDEPPTIVEIQEPQDVAEPEPKPEPKAPPAEPDPDSEGDIESAHGVPPASVDQESFDWFSALSLTLGNLLLIGGAIWLYRRTMSGEKSPEEILDQFSSEKIAAQQPAPDINASADVDADDAEPEMDALGAANTVASAPLADSEQEVADDGGLDDALASIMGELDGDEDQGNGDDDGFGLAENDDQDPESDEDNKPV